MTDANSTLEIRVRGRVQGVGFRPNVYRLARELGLCGEVCNDTEGVLIRASGGAGAMASFLERIAHESPPLARVDTVETRRLARSFDGEFRIVESASEGPVGTEVAPDAAICEACAREVLSPSERRYRYPFTTCTHCGPRLTIVRGVPYDRATTTMAPFALCPACDAEYHDAADRRFHAEATACPLCGPELRVTRADGTDVDGSADALDIVVNLLARGEIVAIKGVGGYQLACDATRRDVVERLRERKRRASKPFALMARDIGVVRRYAAVSLEEERILRSPEAPIVLLDARGEPLPEAIAPGHRTLGFMLPTTPLHLLLLRRVNAPVVMTSGNTSDAPALVDDDAARKHLAGIADAFAMHPRAIANRVDDSVVRVMGGRARLFRRARGYAPAALRLPAGFERAPSLFACGGDLKSTFCVVRGDRAVLAQHQGDLADVLTLTDYGKNVALYTALFEHVPSAIAVDLHPDYAASALGRRKATTEGLRLVTVQHHHAHVAACLAENGWPLDGPRVLGVVLDGLGFGEDGALWGGEFLLADYRRATRLGSLEPTAMLGGDLASREPWRNLYAHVTASMGWDAFSSRYAELDVHRRLAEKPRKVLERMLDANFNAPAASSTGRLFDAVSAALGICFDRQGHEGHAAAVLESLVDQREECAYPFAVERPAEAGLLVLRPGTVWGPLFDDLLRNASPGLVAARFHHGLARGIVEMAVRLREEDAPSHFDAVVLSGGCFQNRVLFEEVSRRLRETGLAVVEHARVPPNDGGLALGQAAIAAARLIEAERTGTNPKEIR